jgi:hypothetical protein
MLGRKLKLFIVSVVLFVPLLAFHNACSPGFKAVDLKKDLSSSLGIDPVLADQGKLVFKKNCSSCHGEVANFNHKNATVAQIQTAVASKIPEMSFLNAVLTSADYVALAEAVKVPVGMPVVQCVSGTNFSKTKIRRLNAREYANSVRDLFQDQALRVTSYPQTTVYSGFDTDQDAVRTYTDDLPAILQITESIVSQLKSKPASLLNSCNASGGGTATTKNAAQITCGKALISRIAQKAYKKIPLATELDPLNTLLTSAVNIQEGVDTALGAVLMAPQFLFHVVDYSVGRQGNLHRLSAFELAARMSYFIWGSLPDDELMTLAQNGQLQSPTVQSTQVRRMLKDPKAADFITRFSQQWLGLSKVNTVTRSSQSYPEFSQVLKDSMVSETTLLFQDTFNRDLPVDAVLTANYTFLNKALADFYKIPFTGPDANNFTSHMLDESTHRRGLLSQAGIMTITSTEAATSPVKRGHFLLDMILCDKTQDPPPGTAEIFAQIDPSLPIRDRLRLHSANPSCASCHQKMDPIGFAYENFDPIGRFRANYTSPPVPVDASGKMPDGFTFTKPTEVPTWFANGDKFEKCVNKYLSSFAVGRLFTDGDTCAANKNIEQLVQQNQNMTFGALVEKLVLSDFFKQSNLQE